VSTATKNGMRRRVAAAGVGTVAIVGALGVGYPLSRDRSEPVRTPAGVHTPDVAAACQVDGPKVVTVPYVVGRHLPDAIARARASGLQVVGNGLPDGDPDGDPAGASAVVRAQKPSAGLRVPVGACIGFRTGP
jgi:hypothetical protein